MGGGMEMRMRMKKGKGKIGLDLMGKDSESNLKLNRYTIL